jgi:hypothetical protein
LLEELGNGIARLVPDIFCHFGHAPVGLASTKVSY